MKPETLAVHAGFHSDPLTGSVMPPIYQTSTYAQESPAVTKGYDYSRGGNPTRTPLQEAVAALESASIGLVYGSGLAAIDCWLNTLQSGDHVIASDDLYGGTIRLFRTVAVHRGLEFSFVDLSNLEECRAALKPNTKWIWGESPTNPTLKLIDIAALAELGHANGAKLGIDNTFMSPILQSPLALGADLVMHSITKYINGHSDVIMGCLATNDEELGARLKVLQNSIGGVPGPMDCFLVLRGIRTLALRMKQHCENGQAVAEFLEGHSKVKRVLYPGLKSHPQHELANRQTKGHGGMVTFIVDGGIPAVTEILKKTHYFKLAESLGGVESLIEHPASMTHASVPLELRQKSGIEDGLIRLSCGVEHSEDLIEDLRQAIG